MRGGSVPAAALAASSKKMLGVRGRAGGGGEGQEEEEQKDPSGLETIQCCGFALTLSNRRTTGTAELGPDLKGPGGGRFGRPQLAGIRSSTFWCQ
jgi:hypothetical protein